MLGCSSNSIIFLLLIVTAALLPPSSSIANRNFVLHNSQPQSDRIPASRNDFASESNSINAKSSRIDQDSSTNWPLLTFGWRTALAIALGALAASLSSAGGVGGGGLYVPIFNLLLDFDSKTSAALSSFMIFGGTLVNIVWYSLQKHPHLGDRPLIDYDVALICQPNLLLGISVGVICNIVSPSWLVTALLIVTLSYMTFRSCKGALRCWNAESNSCRIVVVQSEEDYLKLDGNLIGSDDECPPIYKCSSFVFDKESSPSSLNQEPKDDNSALQKPLLACDSQIFPQFPATKMAMLTLIWLAFAALQLVRGSADGQDFLNIKTCGTAYWLVTISQLPLALGVTACSLYYLKKSSELREGYALEDCSFASSKSLGALPFVAVLAGLLGGMLGLGGGTIINPLLLEIGMHPQVTAATCSFMVLFSSSLSVIQYWFLGRIPVQYALSSAALSLVFSVIGLQLIQKVIFKSGRVSVIVFSVSIVMAISAILMACFGTLDILSEIQQGAYMGFSAPC